MFFVFLLMDKLSLSDSSKTIVVFVYFADSTSRVGLIFFCLLSWVVMLETETCFVDQFRTRYHSVLASSYLMAAENTTVHLARLEYLEMHDFLLIAPTTKHYFTCCQSELFHFLFRILLSYVNWLSSFMPVSRDMQTQVR